MENCKNVLSCSISYRRNIKDMPFVKLLTDSEQAIGVTRSLSEIFGDDFEFKALKNIPLNECKILEEEGVITPELIDNKDISAYGKSYLANNILLINEQDHIRIKSQSIGFDLEKCYQEANKIDDKILDKLEMSFSTEFGFLTSNPNLCGTGMQIEVLLFLPALAYSQKLDKISQDLLKNQIVLSDIHGNTQNITCPFCKIYNKFTFGFKESEFAENINSFVKKIVELETSEENNIFEFSASHLVDCIFRNYGLLGNAYRLDYAETINALGYVLWGINLKVLKLKKQFDILDIMCKIKENHLNSDNLNPKEIEKKRARQISQILISSVLKGEVDV